jgi:tRNA nucleotidyltransferase (CCA-adding enzyme)
MRPSTPNPLHIHAPLDAVLRSLTGTSLSALLKLREIALEQMLRLYLVGGPVRDALMGTPIRDLDFVFEGDAPSLAARLAEEMDGRLVVHPSFGTASVVIEGSTIDLVTARRETYPSPGALPQVMPSGIDDDLARRDFTINAMALPLVQVNPQILDPHSGIDDLKDGIVRVLHTGSFVDDPTRLMRAARYEQRFGFSMEEDTLRELQQAVSGNCLSTVSGDRLRHDLERMFEEERPELAVGRSVRLGILAGIHPSLTDATTIERFAAFTQESIDEPRTGQDPGRASLLSYLAALTYTLTVGDAEGVISRLNMPADWARTVRSTIELKQLEPRLADPSLLDSRLVEMVEAYVDDALIAVAKVTESSVASERLERYLGELRYLSPVLDGRDLMALGVPEGPVMGKILKELKNAKLDGRVSDADDEKRLALESLAQGEQIGNE